MNTEEIQAIFFVECEESLAAAEAGLAACKAGTQDDDTVNAVFRAVHSIKGGAGAFGFTELQAFTHTFETLLSDVRDGTLPLSSALNALMLRALDTLSDHVEAARGNGDMPDDAALLRELTEAQAGGGAAPAAAAAAAPAEPAPEAAPETSMDFDAMLDDLTSALDNAPSSAAPASNGPAPWHLCIHPHAGALDHGREPLLALRELSRMGGRCLGCDISALPQLEELDPRAGYLVWTWEMPATVSQDQVLEIFDFVGEDCTITIASDLPAAAPEAVGPKAVTPPQAQPPAPAPAAAQPSLPDTPTSAEKAPPSQPSPPVAAAASATQTIRIDLPKLDRLIDAVGEMVIAQAMLAQRLGGESLSGIEELAQLDTLTREIQESAMAIRAQPIGSVFSRVPRILRELASSTGKHVRLEVLGEATELDKTVIERLGEPLTHLIRNAVDHGIEPSEERLASGKTADGTLTLSAEQRAGRILIRIADDGRGINREKVFAKAVEKGLVSPDAQLGKEEIDNLIFAPGFSTAATVSSISGRGVGMDVVRQNVKDLGGRITIESEPGKGTIFTLTLPLTLAISDGMIVNVGDQTMVVPLAHIVESLHPQPGDVKGLGASREMLNVRGRFLPILPLHRVLGAAGAVQSPEQGVLIVVETESAGQAALLVDTISDQRQFVIKSLDTHYRAVDGVAGATILGDGRVALILDVDALATRALTSARLEQAA